MTHPGSGPTGYFWDGRVCPVDGCDGELQQQDEFNVICLTCDGVWSSMITEEEWQLTTEDCEVVMRVEKDDDNEQPFGPEDYALLSNAGRCDICGNTVDMEGDGDTLVLQEFGDLDEEVKEEHDLTDQDAIDAIADAMESVAESGAGLELAKVIREDGVIRAHEACLEETNLSLLEHEVEA